MDQAGGAVKPRDLIFQRDTMRLISRQWQQNFTGPQLAVVLMIYDRSIGWGKKQEVISLRQFVAGVVGADGVTYHSGTGCKRTAIKRALSILCAAGAIKRTERGNNRSPYYGINFGWTPTDLKKVSNTDDMKKISTPKRLKTGSSDDTPRRKLGRETTRTGSRNDPQTGSRDDLYKKTEKEEEEKQQNGPVAAGATTESGMVEEQLKKKKAKRKADRAALPLKVTSLLKKDLRNFWRDTIIAHHDDIRVMPLNVAQTAALFSKQKQFLKATKGELSFPMFVEWSIQNWQSVIAHCFNWMNDKPDQPDAWFFLKQFTEFFRIFEQRDRKWQKLTAEPSKDDKDDDVTAELKVITAARKKLELERLKLEIERSKGRRVVRSKGRVESSDANAIKELRQFKWKDEEEDE